MTDHNVDIVALGRELGVMRQWEQLVAEGLADRASIGRRAVV